MAFKAVIFDLFDTLVPGGTQRRDALLTAMADDLGADRGLFKAAFRAGYRERFAGTSGTVGETIEQLGRACGIDPQPSAVAVAATRRMEYTRELLNALPGVEATLSTLADEGWRLGLLTNCSEETVTVWPQTTLAKFFTATVFSCRDGVAKPDFGAYRMVANRLGVETAACVYVADGAGGELTAAQAVGMRTIRVRAEGVDHATFGGDADFDGPVIDDLGQLLAHLPRRSA